ncbi:MAG: hypothetical protein JW716_00075 [Candidatus Aenigmarchaeota archaeon]|nr:hypothetical protein [Candidatus Aenigmarchaeota archaeon]
MIFIAIFLAIAVIGFGYSAYLDLRYTEFPDWLPYSIIIASVIARVTYYISFMGFTETALYAMIPMAATGLAFLGFGLLLYYAGQWGDGDAWLLGGMGFLFPDSGGLLVETGGISFPLVIIFNFFIVSLVYMIFYSLILGMRKREINKEFVNILRKNKLKIELMIASFFLLFAALSSYMYFFRGMQPSLSMIMFPFFISFMIIFFHYGKAVEKEAFKKQIDVKDLREGDVIMDGKWVGVTEEDIGKLQKKGGKIWIKEGVRFAPVFIITILVTLFLGNVIMYIMF